MFCRTSHLFGGIWFLSFETFPLKRTKQYNVEDVDANTIYTIDNDLYVDDCLKSVASEQEAFRLVRQLREVFASGGFRSRDAYPRLSYIADTLATDTGAHARRRKTDTVLQTFSCIFVQDQKHFPWNCFHWYRACYRWKIASHLQAKR